MRRNIILTILLVTIVLILGACKPSMDEIKQGCIDAAIVGIKLDIERLEGYLELPELDNRDKVEEALSKLRIDLQAYQSMKTQDYVLPEPIKIKGYLGEKYVTDSIIYLENQSKSGPFYHAVKILGDRGNEITANKIYTFTIYPVYRRYYPFEAWYVFVSDFEK